MIVKTMTLVATLMAIAGCCSDKDKDRVHRNIQEFDERGSAHCRNICDQSKQDDCWQKLNDDMSNLDGLEIGYLNACDNGDDTLVRQILQDIRDIIGGGTTKASSGLGTSQTGVHNIYDIFASGDTIQLDIQATSTGNSTPIVLATDAQGNVMSGTVALSAGSGTENGAPCNPPTSGQVVMNFVNTSSSEFTISNGSMNLLSNNVQWDSSVSGTFNIVWNEPNPDGSRTGLPTYLNLHINAGPVFDLMLTLDESQPETIATLDANGDGLLAFKATVTLVSFPSTLIPTSVWLELPLHVDATTGDITISTANSYVNAEQIAPRAPNITADPDKNMIVNDDDFILFTSWLDAGDPRADVTNDGIVNNADLDYFLIYWNDEMNR